MLSFRPVELEADRDFILELHCLGNYAGDQPWFRGGSYQAYREKWLATPQPAAFIEQLHARTRDDSVVAEICEESGRAVGYLSIGIYEIDGYGLKAAEVEDIAVQPADQRRGIGTMMLSHAEEIARQHGANLLRADVGSGNAASRALHEKAGFEVSRVQYEKRL